MPVALERDDDAWGPALIRPGTYLVGDARFVIREDGVGGPYATGGVTPFTVEAETSVRRRL